MAKPRIELDPHVSGRSPGERFPLGLVARAAGREVASCEIDVRPTPAGATSMGSVRGLRAEDSEAAAALLADACTRLTDAGAATVVLTGEGWMPRAFAHEDESSRPSGEPRFEGEPGPAPAQAALEAAGFRAVGAYESWIADDLAPRPDARVMVDRFAAGGLSLRPFDRSRADDELAALRALSAAAVGDTQDPIALDRIDAVERLRALGDRLDPELVPIALDRDERPCGGAVAFLDRSERAAPRLVVVSVFAVPARRGHAFGHHILDRLCWSARLRGCSRVIGAVAPVGGPSARMAARRGAVRLERYVAWEWRR